MIASVRNLLEHFEAYLGRTRAGIQGDGTTPPGVQVVRFGADQPFAGVTTVATLGLSHHYLNQPTQPPVRQELLMHVPEQGQPPNLAGVLFQVAEDLLREPRCLLRGEVIGPRGTLFAGTAMTALYAALPVYLPDDFAEFANEDGPVALIWLVAQYGWSAFEDALVVEDPDLTDLNRRSLAVAAGR
jgi:suppressor of fused protein SUFU